MKSLKSILAILLFCSTSTFGQGTLVKNIDPGTWTSNGSYPKFLTRLGNNVVFSAADKQHGSELWITDGTTGGTQILLDINPNPTIGSNIFGSVEMNGYVYFFATGEGEKKGLWKTDGTTLGTVFVKKFDNYDYNNADKQILNVNGTLFFEASKSGIGSELWKSDGTESGTVLVKDINIGSWGSSPKMLTKVNGDVYFLANDGTNGIELWKTDGTTSGTNMVINYNGTSNSGVSNLVSFQGQLFFSYYTATNGAELWKTDGTVSGTQLVSSTANVQTGTERTYAVFNNYLYFSGGPNNDFELWRTDGTTIGTAEFSDFYATGSSDPNAFMEYNGELYFSAQFGSGRGLYKTDGITSSVVSNGSTGGLDPKNFCVHNGILFFQGRENLIGRELWKSNGTGLGTVRVLDMSPNNGDPILITPINATEVVFQGGNVAGNIELWKSNGVGASTSMIKDIFSTYNSTIINGGVSLGNKVFFDSSGEFIESELWETNGTTTGTLLLKNICPSTCSSFPRNFIKVNSSLFYCTVYNSSTNQTAIAKSDGTNAGTIIIKNMTDPNGFVPFNNQFLFYSGTTAIAKTDGTTAGTVVVKSGLNTLTGEIKVINNLAYFLSGNSLWKTDGTTAGTVLVKSFGTLVGTLFELNGSLYIESFDLVAGNQIWKSDGTLGGTQVFMNIPYTTNGSSTKLISETINFNGKTYFSMLTDNSGVELWMTDGTVSGTVILKEIKTGTLGSDPKQFIIYNGKLYFSADDLIHGSELWVTDGTLAGTVMVKDMNPGIQSGAPFNFKIENNKLYFTADNGISGHELWETNGSACGTKMIQDINPGLPSSFPKIIGSIGNQLIINAFEYNVGFELWKYTDNSIQYDTACASFTWSSNNQTYTQSGIYYDTISISGCDSIITLNLTILNATTGVDSQSACGSYTWIDGNTYNSSTNTPTYLLQNALGCDSLITLNLTILQPTSSIVNETSCDNYTWPINNQTYTSSGQYIDTIANAVGCDSIITLNLIILQATSSIVNETSCYNYTWPINNQTYTTSGQYIDTIANAVGCDSIITLNLIIEQPTSSFSLDNVFSLPSDISACNGQIALTLSGTAPFYLDFDAGATQITSNGYSLVSNLCPGVHDLQITVDCGDTLMIPVVIPIDSNYVFNNPFIDSLAQDSLGVIMTNCDIYYNGIDTAYIDSIWANGNTVNVIWNIVDSNGSNFDTTSYVLNNGNGIYWLQLNVFCPNKAFGEYFTVTEAIYFNNGSVSTAGIGENELSNIALFPNPTFDQVTITMSAPSANLRIYDIQGKLVADQKVVSGSEVSLNEFQTGVYLFEVISEGNRTVKRVVKN